MDVTLIKTRITVTYFFHRVAELLLGDNSSKFQERGHTSVYARGVSVQMVCTPQFTLHKSVFAELLIETKELCFQSVPLKRPVMHR